MISAFSGVWWGKIIVNQNFSQTADAVVPLLNDTVDLHAPVDHCWNSVTIVEFQQARFRNQSVPKSENFCRNLANLVGSSLNLAKPAGSGQISAIQSEFSHIRLDSDRIWPEVQPYSWSPAVLGQIPTTTTGRFQTLTTFTGIWQTLIPTKLSKFRQY